ncbi:unnamed protein product [Parnassius apollo]|uniref:(apollo) hypothetical protein n=1 Tax=Parnassius apollo TaxID=110799 RepID=A0A8S3WTH8_PARAO|nr:unnamed protein product [Parnassius apollo]
MSISDGKAYGTSTIGGVTGSIGTTSKEAVGRLAGDVGTADGKADDEDDEELLEYQIVIPQPIAISMMLVYLDLHLGDRFLNIFPR